MMLDGTVSSGSMDGDHINFAITFTDGRFMHGTLNYRLSREEAHKRNFGLGTKCKVKIEVISP